MKATTVEGCRQLPKLGKIIGRTVVAKLDLWEWTIQYRTPISKKANDFPPSLMALNGQDTTVEEHKFKVG